ncbi:hypothetical protein [Fructilactobacillus frigidiflavus]|uniref:hypothetical protein n=1 Tax=Fructilactobacillus frigidiflavus TaxID=3242688 RepID=UPI0037569136
MATSTLFKKLDSNRTTYVNADELGEEVGLNHSMVNQVIRRNKSELENVSREKLNYRRGKNGAKIFLLNQPQAVLATVFMRSNSVVKKFSTDLVKSTYEVPKIEEDEETKQISKTLRSEIKKHDQERHYKKYFDLSYKASLGKSAKQLREQLNIPNGKVVTLFLSADDVKRVNKARTAIIHELRNGGKFSNIAIKLLTR